MDKLTIREATLSDKHDVVGINDGVYEGRDYIASRYEEFVTCPNTTSYVAMMDGKIVAFLAVLRIDDGKTVVTRAGRSSPLMAGKGVYKALKKHGLLEARTRGATVNAFSVFNTNLAIYSHSFRLKNKEIFNKSVVRFLVDSSLLPAPSKDDKSHLHEPDDKEMESYFSNKKIKTYLFPKDVIVCSWVPYKLMPSNLPHMRRPHDKKRIMSDVTVDADGSVRGLLSMSSTFQCVDPPYFTDLDINGTDLKSLKQHLLFHFEIIRKIAKGVVSLLVFIEPDLDREEFNKSLAGQGLEESVWHCVGDSDRTYCEQFVFETGQQPRIAAITFREATLEDKDDVISINNDVYDGRDYLPSRYGETITCPNTTAYVVMMDNKIVGFLAMIILDDGQTVVTRAGRSSPMVAGKGVYKRLKSYVMLEARKKGTKDNAFTALNNNRAIYTESFRMKNKEILVKPMMRFLVDTTTLSASFTDDKIHLFEPDDNEMASYFSNTFSRAYLFPKERIICSWVPYKLLASNLPHLRRPNTNKRIFSDVVVGSDGNVNGLLSISTTVRSQNPPFLTDLDIYGTDARSLMKHILSHFNFMRSIADGVVSLLIFVDPDFDKAEIHNAFAELSLKESVWIDPNNPEIAYSGQILFENEMR